MSLGNHLEELRRKHSDLSELIEAEERRPGVCATYIRGLKRKKLKLKEEIQRKSGDEIADTNGDRIDAEHQGLQTQLAAASAGGRSRTSGPERERLTAALRLVHDGEPQQMHAPTAPTVPSDRMAARA